MPRGEKSAKKEMIGEGDMDKKEFMKVTAEVFRAHGFIKIGNRFFLDLPRVIIKVYKRGARFSPGEYEFWYTACFKDIHEEYIFESKEDYPYMPEDLPCWKEIRSAEIVKDSHVSYRKREFNPEDYTAGRWKKVLEEIIVREFTPYRDDFENYVRENLGPEKTGMGIEQKRAFLDRGLIFKNDEKKRAFPDRELIFKNDKKKRLSFFDRIKEKWKRRKNNS